MRNIVEFSRHVDPRSLIRHDSLHWWQSRHV